MSYLDLLKLASSEAIVTVTALVVLAIGLIRWGEAEMPLRLGASRRTSALCSLVAALGLAFAVGAVLTLPQQAALFGGMLVITPLTSLFKIICIALAFFTVLLASGNDSLRNHGEYLAIILLATVGLMLLVGSEELLMIFIGLELTGLSLYVMTAFDKTDIRSAEASLKYFLFGSTASAFTLFGISFIYGMSGTTSLAAIGQKLTTASAQPLLAVGITMTLIGFAFKIAAAPFHLWAPDAYQGAPVPSAAYRLRTGARERGMARDGRRLVAAARRARRIVHRYWQSGRARPNQRSPTACLLGRRARRVHLARTRRRRPRRIFRDAVLHHRLRIYARRRVRRRRAGATRNRRRRSTTLCRTRVTLANSRRVHVDLHAVAGRLAAALRIFRKVLPVQRRPARRSKPRPALARRACTLWQPHLALLLPNRPQSYFFGACPERSRTGLVTRHLSLATSPKNLALSAWRDRTFPGYHPRTLGL